ncbi:MAG TPA: NAD-dependent succinate-semialdehyde dehydrogenase [Alphaproteobacteria bacterium]|nr:NAD-dependent succinate-semialdehyde dehydrogenase [Alphaproteobacteria bacterium]
MTLGKTLTSRLKDTDLVPEAAYVGGDWIGKAESGESFAVTNPATGEVLATLPNVGVPEARRAIEAAAEAQVAWAAKTGKERASVLRRLHDLMIEHADDLATIMTAEQGKPFAEARTEIAYGAGYVEWFGEEAKRVYGDTIPGHQPDKRIIVIKQPVGVVATITPWNFPNAMLARKMAPALAVGCAVVSKPAGETPLSALALARLAERAGLPGGLFSILPSTHASDLGKEFCANETVRKLSFTGSTEVGRILMAQAAPQIKRLSLELGGNAPFIVFDDADLDAAVEGAIVSKYRNNGQTCVCANRLYVQDSVYEAFAEKLVAATQKLRVGDGFEAGVTLGPLIDQNAVDKVRRHVEDALRKGGTLMLGGKARHGLFFEPTVIAGATPDMLLAREETFGPVAPLFRFETTEDVIRLANATEFGLASYFYASDLRRVWQVAEALDYGMVGINTGLISTEVAPFGGVKQSGFGREGSKYGIEDYLDIKYLCISV